MELLSRVLSMFCKERLCSRPSLCPSFLSRLLNTSFQSSGIWSNLMELEELLWRLLSTRDVRLPRLMLGRLILLVRRLFCLKAGLVYNISIYADEQTKLVLKHHFCHETE